MLSLYSAVKLLKKNCNEKHSLSLAGVKYQPNTDILGSIALSSLPSIEQILSMHLPDGVLMILSAAYLSLVAELKNVLPIMIFIFVASNLVTVYKGLCMAIDCLAFLLT